MKQRDLFIIFALTGAILVPAAIGVALLVMFSSAVLRTPDNPDGPLREGRQLLAERSTEEAIEAFSRAIEAAPQSTVGYLARGDAHLQVGDYQRALADYRAACAIDPNDEDAHFGVARTHMIRATMGGGLSEYEAAAEAADGLLAINPEHVHAYDVMYESLRNLGRPRDAIERLSKGLELLPENLLLRLARAWLYFDVGEYQLAVADYDLILASDDDRATWRELRGRALMFVGRAEDALLDFQRAVDLSPDDGSFLRLVGWALWDLGRYDDALETMATARSYSMTSRDAHFALGAAYLHVDRPDDAIAPLRDAVRTPRADVDYPMLYLWHALSLTAQGDRADRELRAYVQRVRPAHDDAFSRRIAAFLLGEMDEEGLLTLASVDGPRMTASQRQCEAWFYIASMRRRAGADQTDAAVIEALKHCVGSRLWNFYEYQSALAHLRGLNAVNETAGE